MDPFKPGARYSAHVKEGLDRLLSQYAEKPIFRAWLTAYLKQVQLLEDATYDVIVLRLLDKATNAQLDALGRIVGEKRKGRDDETYRTFIRARIYINRSQGRAQDMIDVLYLITTTPLIFNEYFPASFWVEFLEVPEYDPVLILTMLRDTKAGGVGLGMLSPTAPPANQFRWGDSNVAPVSGSTQGFGDVNVASTGGRLSDAVTMRTVL